LYRFFGGEDERKHLKEMAKKMKKKESIESELGGS
jgi:hypothetical protein